MAAVIARTGHRLALAALVLLLVWDPAVGRAESWIRGVDEILGRDFDRDGTGPVRKLNVRRRVDVVRRWNQIAIDASGIDHTPVAPGESRSYGEQLGPGRSSRAMAIVHIAIFDAVNAITDDYESFTGLPPARVGTSRDAAVATAAHDTLVALFPSQASSFHDPLERDLDRVRDRRARARGIALGRLAAERILARVAGDFIRQQGARLRAEPGAPHRARPARPHPGPERAARTIRDALLASTT